MLSRSFAASCSLLALGAACVAPVACSQPPVARPPATAAPAPQRSATPSRWQTVAAPPLEDANAPGFDLPDAKLVIDASGGRWLFRTNAPAREAGNAGANAGGSTSGKAEEGGDRPTARVLIDEGPLLARYLDPKLGLLALAGDGRLLGSADPLGTLRTVATLPRGTKPGSLRFFRGGITFFAEDGPAVIGQDGSRKRVPTMPGYTLAEALLGADGAGVGLFLPEAVGVTRDGGTTWTRVDTNDLRVTSLRIQDGAPLLVPGGVRDGFARSIDIATGALERIVERQTPSEKRADARERTRRRRGRGLSDLGMEGFELIGAPLPPWSHERLSPELALSGQRGGPAVGGDDRVVTFHADHRDRARTLMRRGRIGEALASYGGEALGECTVLGAATCGDRTAVLCGEKLHVFRGDEPVVTLAAALGTQIAFDREGRLVAVVPDPEAHTVSLRRWTDDYAAAVSPEPVAGITRGPLTLLGGCGGPAFWIAGGGAAVRWSPELRAFESAIELSPDATPIAVSHERSLVASNGLDLLFFPEETSAPLGPHQVGYVSFTRGGRHALYVAPSGQVQQSDDGGRSFSPIASPAVRGRLPVLCGDQRCQLGEGAFREGFTRESEPIVAWPDPPSREKSRRPRDVPSPPTTNDEPPAMTCQEDAALFADHVGGPITPRLGPWLFAGASANGKGGYLATFGDVSGKASQAKLPTQSVRENGGIEAGAGFVVTTTWNTYRQSLSGVFRWEPRAAPATIAPMPYGSPTLLSENGLGTIDYPSGELVLWGKERTQRRAYRAERRGRDSGLLHVEADNGWIAGEMVDRGELRLVVMPEGGRSEDRVLRVNPNDTPEQAVGFMPGPTRRIVLLETTEDHGTELRIRPVSAAFALGEAKAIPGTRTARGLLDLPTCAPSATGALVYARSYGNRTVQIGKQRTSQEFSRLLRVTESSACVERTFGVAGPDILSARVLVAGNGGVGVDEAGSGGLRCSPLDPRPLPPSP